MRVQISTLDAFTVGPMEQGNIMQPKLLWGGVAIVGLGLVVGLVAVYYAALHPGSLMAQMGVVLVSGDLHTNPLCDASCVVKGKSSAESDAFETGLRPTTFKSSPPRFKLETIEPIQIEPMPPPTIETPAFEASEWRPLSRPLLPLVIDETPMRMPLADETLRSADTRMICFTVFDAIGALGLTCFDFAVEMRTLSVLEKQRQDYPGQQLIDPPAGCGHGGTLSWDLRYELDPSKCEPWCPLASALRVMCVPWLGWFDEKPSGQEEQREPPIAPNVDFHAIDPLVLSWLRSCWKN